MAATFAFRATTDGSFHPETVPGSRFCAILEVTAGAGDYLAGGYSVNIASLNTVAGGAYSAIQSVDVVDHWRTVAGGGTSAFIAVYDSVNQKVQAYGMNAAAGISNPLTEIANAAPGLNGLRCSLRVWFN